jgi:hypothetical protein
VPRTAIGIRRRQLPALAAVGLANAAGIHGWWPAPWAAGAA